MVYNLFIRYVMQNIQFVCNVIRSSGLYLKKKIKRNMPPCMSIAGTTSEYSTCSRIQLFNVKVQATSAYHHFFS